MSCSAISYRICELKLGNKPKPFTSTAISLNIVENDCLIEKFKGYTTLKKKPNH